ncbi:PREDICTED: putative F-box protein At3g10240 [Camelina sativa]|uniref:F-box protein At3g10240 n=1 Tax=Camelina sativa TaxID=90675 RepID=A0ABM0WNK3_CAMSA|nr:PREDICTED: putative F-box protein At3g10240 [Camelina sativa]
MSSPVMNQDMTQEVLSYLPASDLGKFRLLNKECNKRSYESWFLDLNLHRTNSVSGCFLQSRYYEQGYKIRTSFIHERSNLQNNDGVSIDFLPPGNNVKIKACDASHGILLCVNDRGVVPEYIVCKPTTKQYQIIPNPNGRSCDRSLGIAVIGLDPFRYKIIRLSKTSGMDRNLRTLACEVFDSGSFAWKRLKNLRLPRTDGLILSNPVQASGFLHWRSRNDNVIRFCLKTEAWSFLHTPNFGVFPKLVIYVGKLGVIREWTGKDQEDVRGLWVLKSSIGKSWIKVRDIKSIGVSDNILWTPSNDVVTLWGWDRVCFYTINTKRLNIVHTNTEFAYYVCFPFCSDYERVDLDQRQEDTG